ncbi:synaptic vesicle glycoprotein 2C-like isoform X1 [Artemia franciscana]|uniref:synaptic vesicle glycoprotein 2C-like isoform X1 n=1 Tax=Artemia franciscana TaxID=6661 RepID=UPI0032DAA0B3
MEVEYVVEDDYENVRLLADEDLDLRQENDEDRVDYEDAIEATGYGRFHYLLLLICGWANAADAVEIICVSFLLPSAECDLNLSSQDKGWLSAIVFVGMMVGGYLWGSLGDALGRRGVLMAAMFVNALFGAISSLSQDFGTFLTFRFLSGVGVGGSIPVVWSYFAEFQPKRIRGNLLSCLAAFWMLGNMVVAGLAWAVIPQDLGYSGEGFKYNSWRIFTLLSALPSLTVCIALLLLPESPKYLLAQGRDKDALKVFRRIYSMNTRKNEDSYPYTKFVAEFDSNKLIYKEMSLFHRIKITVLTVSKKTAAIFRGRVLRPTLLMLIINFCIQFGYYGLWLWFPELFTRLSSVNYSVSICEVTSLSNTTDSTPSHCINQTPPNDEVFINAFITAAAPLPANLWTMLMMDKLGRKFFLVISMVGSGLCAFGIYLVNSEVVYLIISCLFGAISTMGFNALDCLGAELFPTSLRGTAMAVTLAAARLGAILGNLLFGFLVDVACAVPIILVAVLLIGGGLLGLLLPNTTREPLL